MSAQTSKSIQHSIQAAMSSLDLKLEDELTLFRNRHNQVEGVAPVVEDTSPAPEIPAIEETPQEPVQETTFQPTEPITTEPSVDLAAEAARLLDVKFDDGFDEAEFEAELELPSPELEPPEEFEPEPTQVSLDEEEDIPPGAIVPSKALLPSENALADSAKLKTYTDPALDDYLESSEVLLKHLDTPVPKQQIDDSNTLKWFGWAAAATVILSVIAAFLLQNVFKTPGGNDPSPEPTATEIPAPAASPSAETSPSPTVSPTPSATVQPPNLEEDEFQSVTPGNLAGLPSPEASSTPATESSSPTPTNTSGRKYYVVTDYSDEASLTKAKESFPDAKVVNFTAGTRIQLQEFSDETSARTAAAEFQQKGFAVEILATAGE